MITSGSHRLRRIAEKSLAVMLDLADFSMHEPRCPHHVSPEGRSQRLMPQTNSQNRQLPGKIPDQFNADAGLLRCARTRRDKNVMGLHRPDLFRSDLIVAPDLDLLA